MWKTPVPAPSANRRSGTRNPGAFSGIVTAVRILSHALFQPGIYTLSGDIRSEYRRLSAISRFNLAVSDVNGVSADETPDPGTAQSLLLILHWPSEHRLSAIPFGRTEPISGLACCQNSPYLRYPLFMNVLLPPEPTKQRFPHSRTVKICGRLKQTDFPWTFVIHARLPSTLSGAGVNPGRSGPNRWRPKIIASSGDRQENFLMKCPSLSESPSEGNVRLPE